MPDSFNEINATISNDYEERGAGLKFGIHYTHYIDVNYSINNKEYSSSLFWCKGDAVGKKIYIIVSKHRLFIFRKNFSFSYEDFYRLVFFLSGVGLFLKILFDAPDRMSKSQKNEEKMEKERQLLRCYKISDVNRESECKYIKKYLKKVHAMKLYEEISLIFKCVDLQELVWLGFLFNKSENEIDFIAKTKENWNQGHFVNYIILQIVDAGYIMYSIREDCIYFYDKRVFKYDFISGSLIKYLILLKNDSFINQMVV